MGGRRVGCVDALWNNNFNRITACQKKLEVKLSRQLRNGDRAGCLDFKASLKKRGPRKAEHSTKSSEKAVEVGRA